MHLKGLLCNSTILLLLLYSTGCATIIVKSTDSNTVKKENKIAKIEISKSKIFIISPDVSIFDGRRDLVNERAEFLTAYNNKFVSKINRLTKNNTITTNITNSDYRLQLKIIKIETQPFYNYFLMFVPFGYYYTYSISIYENKSNLLVYSKHEKIIFSGEPTIDSIAIDLYQDVLLPKKLIL